MPKQRFHLGRRTALGLVGAGLAAPFIRPSFAQAAWPEQTTIPDILKGSGEVRIAGYAGTMQEAQMKGADDAGGAGWMLWNPRNDYTAAALRPKEAPQKETLATK